MGSEGERGAKESRGSTRIAPMAGMVGEERGRRGAGALNCASAQGEAEKLM